MDSPLPITRELLLIGGGHTHALVARMWGMNPLAGVRVTLVNPDPTAPYSGMLPGFVAGHYSRDDLDIDLVRLARFARARLIVGRACHIDLAARTVTLNTGRVLHYHVVSIDIGITSDMPDLNGFQSYATPAKPLGNFARLWDAFHATCTAKDTPARAAVIGGGIAGVELAMAMGHALQQSGNKPADITVLERDKLLPNMGKSDADFFRTRLKRANIRVLENVQISAIEPGRINLADGTVVAADFITGAAGTKPHDWLGDTGLTLENGYISVDTRLRALNNPGVFAAGDCAHMRDTPRPKAGVFAVRQAPALFHNLRAELTGGTLRPYAPQKDYFKLISMGGKTAFAHKWGMRLSGPLAWRLKDRIDQKFMAQFQTLKPMSLPKLPNPVALGVAQTLGQNPLCGGCGAKVGGKSLNNALDTLNMHQREDVLTGPGDDAAILAGPGGQFQVISTDHLRAFTNDAAVMARIAAVHALGDVWAMGASAQSALASITLPRLSPDLQQVWLAEIMAAANAVFSAEGAAIIGGHSAQGAELSIGFTVTGLASKRPISKNGARVGDTLILTKPIGTGVIMAAEMALVARSNWVIGALDSMCTPQGDAARALNKAHALTDVTGFGLAGHLGEIAHASGVGIALDLAAVPVLDGALELARAGVRSSLYGENRALATQVHAADNPKADLLFDPQTAGGLLAAVSLKQVLQVINDLKALGCDPHVIGHCTNASDGVHLI